MRPVAREAPPPRVHIPAVELDGLVIDGKHPIVPDDVEWSRELGVSSRFPDSRWLENSVMVCIDRAGGIESTELVARSTDSAFDARCVAAIRSWTLRPYVRDGVPIEVCGLVFTSFHRGKLTPTIMPASTP